MRAVYHMTIQFKQIHGISGYKNNKKNILNLIITNILPFQIKHFINSSP